MKPNFLDLGFRRRHLSIVSFVATTLFARTAIGSSSSVAGLPDGIFSHQKYQFRYFSIPDTIVGDIEATMDFM
jgi:hypothetical protein